MRTMCRIVYMILMTITVSLELSAQNYFFAEARENRNISHRRTGKRVIIPEKYKSVVLDIHGMQAFLKTLAQEPGLAARENASIIELPMPDGGRASIGFGKAPLWSLDWQPVSRK